jgi:hypothetical protein
MAQNGCWGPMCEFTGTSTKSDANAGRCTGQSGYLSYAEITEIIKREGSARTFYDDGSDSDILLYQGLCSSSFFLPDSFYISQSHDILTTIQETM